MHWHLKSERASGRAEIANVKIIFFTFSISALPPWLLAKFDFTSLIHGPLLKKLSLRFLITCVFIDLALCIASTINSYTKQRGFYVKIWFFNFSVGLSDNISRISFLSWFQRRFKVGCILKQENNIQKMILTSLACWHMGTCNRFWNDLGNSKIPKLRVRYSRLLQNRVR